MSVVTTPSGQALLRAYLRSHPAEAARLAEQADSEDVLRLLGSAPAQEALEVFQRLTPGCATAVAALMPADLFRALFTLLEPSRAGALIARFEEEVRDERLRLLPENVAAELREVLSYAPDSAGYLMDRRVDSFRELETVEQALTRIRSGTNRRIHDLFVVDDLGHLIASVPLLEVATSPGDLRLGALVSGHPPAAIEETRTRDDAIVLLQDKGLANLPVVDYDGRLVGVIRHEAAVEAARQDASEDMLAMVGAGARERALSSPFFVVRTRLPWLEINLVSAFLAASVVALFEGTIARITALAVFLPVVAGQAGNTGAQAMAVTMRGLVLREIFVRSWPRILGKEAAAGLMNGSVTGLVTGLVVAWWTGTWALGLIICIAMIIAMAVAGLAGATIPMILTALKQDPARSSTIFLTTITDITGFFTFLGLAHLLAAWLGLG